MTRRYTVILINENRQFEFDDFGKAVAYCKELDFHGHEFLLTAANVEEIEKAEALA